MDGRGTGALGIATNSRLIMRIAILGGGVAGVVLARELSEESNAQVELFERNSELGGLQRSQDIGGFQYDIGAYVFAYEHELLRTFPVLYDHFIPLAHRALVLTRHNTFDAYPMTMRGYLRDNGLRSIPANAARILAAKFIHRRRDSLLSYIKYYLGESIYRNSGLKAYIERFHATPDTDIDLEFALQRMWMLPEKCSLRRNFVRIMGSALTNAPSLDTWDCLVRPREGFGAVYSIIGRELVDRGVALHLNSAIERIERKKKKFVIRFDDRRAEIFDLVISTIPIGTMLRLIGQPAARPPETVRLTTLCYRFQGDLGFANADIIYNFTCDGAWKRINFYTRLYGKIDGDDCFLVECTHRPEARMTERILKLDFEDHVSRVPILLGALKYQGSIETDDAYPFFRRNDLQRIDQARRILEEYGIVLVGRQGTFTYSSAHLTALRAREVADRIRSRSIPLP